MVKIVSIPVDGNEEVVEECELCKMFGVTKRDLPREHERNKPLALVHPQTDELYVAWRMGKKGLTFSLAKVDKMEIWVV